MEMHKIVFLCCFLCLMDKNIVFSKKIEEIFTCVNDTDCDALTDFETQTESVVTEDSISLEHSTTTFESTTSANTTTSLPTTTSESTSTISLLPKAAVYVRVRNPNIQKVQSDVCDCDLTIFSCDINCCCDPDCNKFHVTSFSHCRDHHPELYDSRYCYNKNFIERNNTPFILEKLANNLFCILYDNLPPTYSVSNDLNLKSATELNNAIDSSKPSWKWEYRLNMLNYNMSNFFQHGDTVWKFYQNQIEPLELLQAGFTGLCTLKKVVKYLHDWKESCLQTVLEDSNLSLFPNTYNNFSIISSPHLLNETYYRLSQDCPRNICLPITNHFCEDSWKNCNVTAPKALCSHGMCFNIITGVRYLITHNGSMGINSIDAYLRIGNVSKSFYQDFEVAYKWLGIDKETFPLSGNPGYNLGKPIPIGTLILNKTEKSEIQYIQFNKSSSFLTLPKAGKDGRCGETERHTIAFGDNIKLKCKVLIETNNFTSQTCMILQNYTFNLLLKDSLFNVTDASQYRVYVSKSGNYTKNDTASWVKILLNTVPQNVIRGQVLNGRLRCSGLITSVHYHILYSTLPKPETLTNHNILGIGLNFSDEIDVTWKKCSSKNCTDSLIIDTVSFVTFHDVSKPSKFYFVGAPNLDITLPYDFFYPFLSRSESIKPITFLVCALPVYFLHSYTFYL